MAQQAAVTAASRPRVVIVGAGFGGLEAARSLAHAAAEVMVIDAKNHHTFQPLLYQVATAALSPATIAWPIRHLLKTQANAQVLMTQVVGVDPAAHQILTEAGPIAYDQLVIATGAAHSYFGQDSWEPFAPGLKTLEDAIGIRRRILSAFERAELAGPGKAGPELTTFVVVGGGPTGVELAGTLAEISRHALAHEFRSIDPARTHILLLEGGPRLLPAYAEDLSGSAQEQLHRLGVEVRTSTTVTQIEPGAVYAGSTRLPATVVLWAAGVAASALGKSVGAPVDRAGRVLVQPDLSVPGHPEVFVIGDLAAVQDEHGKMLPGVAPVAIQQGRFVAKVIREELESQARPARFHYWDKGSLATIGRAAAVAEFGRIHISGFVAWLSWLFVHILFLIGFRNRLLVFIQWAWSYVTYERGARLITGSTYLPGWSSDQQVSGETTKPGPQEIHTGPAK